LFFIPFCIAVNACRTRNTALALPTAPTLPTARFNIDIEQVGVPFKCPKQQIISRPEGNFVKLSNGKVIIAYNYICSVQNNFIFCCPFF
jgi:hypothetical protein